MSNVNFISGLPRSGSTLLAALLSQNPAIGHAGYSSPLAALMQKVSSVFVEGEYAGEISSATQRQILRGLVENFYGPRAGDAGGPGGIIDTNRLWCTRLPLLRDIFPGCRVICCVRDPVRVIDSFERLFQNDPMLASRLVPIQRRASLYERVDHLLSPEGVFGYAWRALNEAWFGLSARTLLLVDYDALVSRTPAVLDAIEMALGLPPHRYDLAGITLPGAERFDASLATPGLHAVRATISPRHDTPVLPPDIVARLAGGSFWRDPSKNPRGVAVIA